MKNTYVLIRRYQFVDILGVYNDRSKRERRIYKDDTNKVFTYWCFCGLVR